MKSADEFLKERISKILQRDRDKQFLDSSLILLGFRILKK